MTIEVPDPVDTVAGDEPRGGPMGLRPSREAINGGGLPAERNAALLRIAIIWCRIHIKPDMVHVREIATDLFDQLVPDALCTKSGAFHDSELFELWTGLQNHIEI